MRDLNLFGWTFSGAALAALLLFGAAAPAQVFSNHNSNAPVSFDAGRIELQDRADRVVLSGAVRVEQAGLTLNADRMTVAYSNSGGVDINRIDAAGGVVVRKDGDVARGNSAIYDLDRRQITMLGGVELLQAGGNRLSGGRLVIELGSGRAIVDGRSSGGPTNPDTPSSGRVSGTFSVPQRGN